MNYMGSKNRIAKQLLSVMLPERKPGQLWVEPFVGGANMIDKVDGKRWGNDKHEYLIALLQAVSHGWVPPVNLSKDEYYAIKKYPEFYPTELVGFAGFLCSFAGKWRAGYATNKANRNYAAIGSRVLVKQSENLKGVYFTSVDYLDMVVPDDSFIYCDPPYADTAGYKGACKFDHGRFWDWCRLMSVMGHTVFISEYTAPDDFECILEVSHKTIVAIGQHASRLEKLFKYKY